MTVMPAPNWRLTRGLTQRLTPGVIAAWGTLAVFVVCLALEAAVPWLSVWPEAWTLPMTEWIRNGLEPVLLALKPVARGASWLLGFPMAWVKSLLTQVPAPLVIGFFSALGWWIWGWRGASLTALGLGFVVASGYWVEGMNTLSLVFVSVPLAVALGMAIGLLAFEVPAIRKGVLAVLDVMQTVPTFAYLTPLLFLFGFGPVVGLIASAIYAAPPMARSVILGLDRVEPDIREAAVMSGGTRFQQLFLVEIPAARDQIMVGVNQCLMAALSMVIIAAVIGGFEDIGWEVLSTMRQAKFGPALLAGLVIVIFAIIIDRLSSQLAHSRERFSLRGAGVIFAIGAVVAILPAEIWTPLWSLYEGFWSLFNAHIAGDVSVIYVQDIPAALESWLSGVNRAHGAALQDTKNTILFFGFLPVRIGFEQAVLPFTWGVMWTPIATFNLYLIAGFICLVLSFLGRPILGASIALAALLLLTGVTGLPWPVLIVGAALVGWVAGGWRLATLAAGLLFLILLSGLWDKAMLSIYLCGLAVMACVVLGGALGLLAAVSRPAWTVLQLICDMLQTIPLFVFLIPFLMFFQIGEFTAFLAIVAYAIVPMIRYTRFGLTNTPAEMLEAAVASGATPWQILKEVRFPYAMPAILLGLNQTILYGFAMLVIAALVGTTGLGQSIFVALGEGDVGLGIAAGAAMAMLALIADRLVQGFAEERRRALGL